MVSVEQLTALIEFMESHTEVALGRLNRSKEGCSQTAFGRNVLVFSTPYRLTESPRRRTSGGPSKVTPLTPLQERLYVILGRDFGEPLQGIRHNPLSVS
ncbi:hypothetical protein ABMA27_003410 [Loxostege sticticalis]|uniref:Uncharacterized protein n=1 Tax=Loxostege sticticalis TaxID=481309 RepID=A0ABR3HT03_LOXSC